MTSVSLITTIFGNLTTAGSNNNLVGNTFNTNFAPGSILTSVGSPIYHTNSGHIVFSIENNGIYITSTRSSGLAYGINMDINKIYKLAGYSTTPSLSAVGTIKTYADSTIGTLTCITCKKNNDIYFACIGGAICAIPYNNPSGSTKAFNTTLGIHGNITYIALQSVAESLYGLAFDVSENLYTANNLGNISVITNSNTTLFGLSVTGNTITRMRSIRNSPYSITNGGVVGLAFTSDNIMLVSAYGSFGSQISDTPKRLYAASNTAITAYGKSISASINNLELNTLISSDASFNDPVGSSVNARPHYVAVDACDNIFIGYYNGKSIVCFPRYTMTIMGISVNAATITRIAGYYYSTTNKSAGNDIPMRDASFGPVCGIVFDQETKRNLYIIDNTAYGIRKIINTPSVPNYVSVSSSGLTINITNLGNSSTSSQYLVNGGTDFTNHYYSLDNITYNAVSGTSTSVSFSSSAGNKDVFLKSANKVGNSAVYQTTISVVGSVPRQPTLTLTQTTSAQIVVSITEPSPPTDYYLNEIQYYYYLYSSGSDTSSQVSSYTNLIGSLNSASYPPITTTIGSLLNQTYIVYVIAKNSLGNSLPVSQSISALITPNQPTITSAISNNAQTLTITIGDTSTYNSAAGYNGVSYFYSMNGTNYGNSLAVNNGSTTYTFTISDVGISTTPLTNISYTLYVRGNNSVGFSASSTQQVVVYQVPRTPTSFSWDQTLNQSGSIKVDITETSPPANYHLNDVYYHYYLYDGVSSNQSANSLVYSNSLVKLASAATTATFTIPDITIPQSYTLYVIGKNPIGNSLPPGTGVSASVQITPSSVVISSVSAPSSGNLRVNFTDTNNVANNGITYVYYAYATGTNEFGNIAKYTTGPSYGTTTFDIPGLTNQSYTIYLSAKNDVGNSAIATSSSTTAYITPSTPNSVEITNPTAGNIQCTITDTTNSSTNNISYLFYVFRTGSGTNNSDTIGAYASTGNTLINGTTTYQFSVLGYTTDGSYTMYIIAQNSVGNSAPRASSSILYLYVAPQAPTIDDGNTLSAASGQITISLFDTANSPTNNVYYWYSIDNGANYIQSSAQYTGIAPNRYSFVISTGLTNGTPYTIYVRAQNEVGFSSYVQTAAITPYTTPDSPTALVAVSGNQAIDISFVAPVDNGGNTITAYYYSTDGGSTYANIGLTTQYTIPSLTNGTQYNIVVIAQNYRGNSSASSSVLSTPYTIPTAPVLLAAVSGDQTIDISFSAPSSDGGNAITAYYYSTNGGSTYASIGLNTQYQITGLTNGTLYTIVVAAQNARGNSSPSNSIQSTPSTIPGTPVLLSAVPKNYAIDISFSIPSDGGNAISLYEYSLNGSGFAEMTPTPTNNKYTITSLSSGTSYSVAVRVKNIRGYSNTSNSLSATPYGIPNAPVIYGKPTDTTIDVSFDSPTTGGSDITKYQYSIGTLSPSSTFIDVPGLLPAGNKFTISTISGSAFVQRTKYYIQMRAVNIAGNSVPSNTLSIAPSILPSEPTITTLVPLSGGIQIIFTPPTDNGGSEVISYKYAIEPL
jgi:hypothetical protein